MGGHAQGQPGQRPERRKIGGIQQGPVDVDDRKLRVAVLRGPAMTRQMLEDRQHAPLHEPRGDGAGDRGNLLGRLPIGPVADHRVGAGHRDVGDRQAIHVDAE